MNNIAQAVWVEMLKARRSRMPLLTALGFSLVPLAGGFFMIVLKDPELTSCWADQGQGTDHCRCRRLANIPWTPCPSSDWRHHTFQSHWQLGVWA